MALEIFKLVKVEQFEILKNVLFYQNMNKPNANTHQEETL